MTLSQTTQFKKDIKRQVRQGKDQKKLIAVVNILLDGSPLPPKNMDHPLKGAWKGRRDCHIEPDWILIYRVSEDELRLERTGPTATSSDGLGEQFVTLYRPVPRRPATADVGA